jgi:hypothetical protein
MRRSPINLRTRPSASHSQPPVTRKPNAPPVPHCERAPSATSEPVPQPERKTHPRLLPDPTSRLLHGRHSGSDVLAPAWARGRCEARGATSAVEPSRQSKIGLGSPASGVGAPVISRGISATEPPRASADVGSAADQKPKGSTRSRQGQSTTRARSATPSKHHTEFAEALATT